MTYIRPVLSTASICVVIPALNEGRIVIDTVTEVQAALEQFFSHYEIVLVNDASTDNTGSIMDELAARDSRIRVVHNQQNLGFGGAYKRGVGAAKCEYVIMVPGDNAFSTKSLKPIFSAVGKADIVIPVVSNTATRKLGRRIASRGFTVLINLLFGLRVGYYNGPVVHRSDLLRRISITTDGFAYQAEALVKLLKQGHSSIEVKTEVQEREIGKSKALKLKNLATVLGAVLHLLRECSNSGASGRAARRAVGTGS